MKKVAVTFLEVGSRQAEYVPKERGLPVRMGKLGMSEDAGICSISPSSFTALCILKRNYLAECIIQTTLCMLGITFVKK